MAIIPFKIRHIAVSISNIAVEIGSDVVKVGYAPLAGSANGMPSRSSSGVNAIFSVLTAVISALAAVLLVLT